MVFGSEEGEKSGEIELRFLRGISAAATLSPCMEKWYCKRLMLWIINFRQQKTHQP